MYVSSQKPVCTAIFADWDLQAYEIPPGTNLYGDHPVYFDHRGANGTHGVFLLNSNGMRSPRVLTFKQIRLLMNGGQA